MVIRDSYQIKGGHFYLFTIYIDRSISDGLSGNVTFNDVIQTFQFNKKGSRILVNHGVTRQSADP